MGEGSKDLHLLIRTLAEQRVASKARARGWEGSETELGLVLGHIRRSLSLTFIRAQGLCLLSRLCHLGPRAKEAAGRREVARRAEVRRGREMDSHFLAHVRGRGMAREGTIFVP